MYLAVHAYGVWSKFREEKHTTFVYTIEKTPQEAHEDNYEAPKGKQDRN